MEPFIDQAAVQPAPVDEHVHYERRRPEETTFYQLVQENAETFFAQVEAETGAGLPDFVKAEFDLTFWFRFLQNRNLLLASASGQKRFASVSSETFCDRRPQERHHAAGLLGGAVGWV